MKPPSSTHGVQLPCAAVNSAIVTIRRAWLPETQQGVRAGRSRAEARLSPLRPGQPFSRSEGLLEPSHPRPSVLPGRRGRSRRPCGLLARATWQSLPGRRTRWWTRSGRRGSTITANTAASSRFLSSRRESFQRESSRAGRPSGTQLLRSSVGAAGRCGRRRFRRRWRA
eukprot:230697-Chlamydomonas_euryale.AAC.4